MPPRLAPTMMHRVAAGDGAFGLMAFGLGQLFKRAQARMQLLALWKASELR